MRDRLSRALIALAIVFGLGGAAVASPAQANGFVPIAVPHTAPLEAAKRTDCLSGQTCFYNANTPTGSNIWWSSASVHPAGACQELPASIDNLTSYIINKNGYKWVVYTGDNCSGSYAYLQPWLWGPMEGIWNNNIESIKRTNIYEN